MKIAIGSDHRGVELKDKILEYLKNNKIEGINCGTNSEERADYPEIAKQVALKIQNNECDKGILICGTGIGMSIAANKFKNIRCALCYNEETAKYAKLHNNANIIAIGASQFTIEQAIQMVDIWLKSNFEGERHTKRIELISEIEKQNMK